MSVEALEGWAGDSNDDGWGDLTTVCEALDAPECSRQKELLLGSIARVSLGPDYAVIAPWLMDWDDSLREDINYPKRPHRETLGMEVCKLAYKDSSAPEIQAAKRLVRRSAGLVAEWVVRHQKAKKSLPHLANLDVKHSLLCLGGANLELRGPLSLTTVDYNAGLHTLAAMERHVDFYAVNGIATRYLGISEGPFMAALTHEYWRRQPQPRADLFYRLVAMEQLEILEGGLVGAFRRLAELPEYEGQAALVLVPKADLILKKILLDSFKPAFNLLVPGGVLAVDVSTIGTFDRTFLQRIVRSAVCANFMPPVQDPDSWPIKTGPNSTTGHYSNRRWAVFQKNPFIDGRPDIYAMLDAC